MMRKRFLPFVCLATVATVSGEAMADSPVRGSMPFFTPLTESAPVTDPNSPEEKGQPWIMPEGLGQDDLTNMDKIEADPENQSVVRMEKYGRGASMWDMVAYDDSGRYVFIPHETRSGAGVSRYDSQTDVTEVLFAGDGKGDPADENTEADWSNDWGAFDPCTFSPNQTLLLGEEWAGEGRIMEVMNPFAAVEDIQVRELESIANVSHEGLRFSKDGRTLYYVDEWRSGSIYKFVALRKQPRSDKWDYTRGQTFVLKVDAFDGVASDLYNDESNEGKTRTGAATWVALTDKRGRVRRGITNPFRNGPTNDPRENDDTRGGRVAADEVGATPFGRPEDMEIGVLANGNEVLYFAATSEQTVYSIELKNKRKAHVRVFASEEGTPKNAGFAPTTGKLNSPDNLAQDGFGNIYIIEDAPNGSDEGGDIWFVRDTNRDGVAESIDHFLSIRVRRSEATGMIFNPNKPTEFVVAVQHPESTDLEAVPNGVGDALWKFDIGDLVEPPCASGEYISDWISEGYTTCSEIDAHVEEGPGFHEDFWGWWIHRNFNNPWFRQFWGSLFGPFFGGGHR